MPKGNGSGTSVILHTADQGKHWVRLPFAKTRSGEDAPAFFFLDSIHGWISSFDSWSAQGSLYSTADGGRSWKHTASDAVGKLQFFDVLHGHFAGTALSGGFFGTTSDGGATWARTDLPLSHVDDMSSPGDRFWLDPARGRARAHTGALPGAPPHAVRNFAIIGGLYKAERL